MAGTSESARKAAKTRKRKDPNAFKKIGARGGRTPKRGYLGRLKDEGRLEELKRISSLGTATRYAKKTPKTDETERD